MKRSPNSPERGAPPGLRPSDRACSGPRSCGIHRPARALASMVPRLPQGGAAPDTVPGVGHSTRQSTPTLDTTNMGSAPGPARRPGTAPTKRVVRLRIPHGRPKALGYLCCCPPLTGRPSRPCRSSRRPSRGLGTERGAGQRSIGQQGYPERDFDLYSRRRTRSLWRRLHLGPRA